MGAFRVKCFWMVWLSLAGPTWLQRPVEHCFAMWLNIWQIDLGDSYFCHTNVLNVCFNQKLRNIGINIYMYVGKKSWRSDVIFSMPAFIGEPHYTHVSAANCQITDRSTVISRLPRAVEVLKLNCYHDDCLGGISLQHLPLCLVPQHDSSCWFISHCQVQWNAWHIGPFNNCCKNS